jgi:hypothetical protein
MGIVLALFKPTFPILARTFDAKPSMRLTLNYLDEVRQAAQTPPASSERARAYSHSVRQMNALILLSAGATNVDPVFIP